MVRPISPAHPKETSGVWFENLNLLNLMRKSPATILTTLTRTRNGAKTALDG